jgi:hypothetical protein
MKGEIGYMPALFGLILIVVGIVKILLDKKG